MKNRKLNIYPFANTEAVADFSIRDFPIRLRQLAKAQAAVSGLSLREYIIHTIATHVTTPVKEK